MDISAKQPSLPKEISTTESLKFVEKKFRSFTLAEKFTEICNELKEYRIILLPAMLLFQGAVLVPAAVLITSFIDLGMAGVAVALLAANTVAVLITTISDAPIKITLSTFLFSLISSIALIAIHLLSVF